MMPRRAARRARLITLFAFRRGWGGGATRAPISAAFGFGARASDRCSTPNNYIELVITISCARSLSLALVMSAYTFRLSFFRPGRLLSVCAIAYINSGIEARGYATTVLSRANRWICPQFPERK